MVSLNSNTSAIIFACLAVLMSFLRRYQPFKVWFTSLFETSLSDYFLPSKQILASAPEFTLTRSNTKFKDQTDATLYELTQTLNQLQEYLVRGQRQNGVVFNRTKELQPKYVKELRSINYFSKIDAVNKSIEKNYISVQLIIRYTLKKLIENNRNNKDVDENLPDILQTTCAELGYTIKDEDDLEFIGQNVVLDGSISNQSRVVEALGHLCRDWSKEFECERQPLNSFVQERLESVLNTSSQQDSLIIVPGAGLGQLAHHIASNFPNCQIDSIEWSSLMYLFNQFALDHPHNLRICPFSQYYSGHIDTTSQTRDIEINLMDIHRPPNLSVNWGDFRQYTVNENNYKKMFVCTAFFIDTAENLFEYIQTIESLANHCEELHWINIGPLKYGTRPLIQFTASELSKLREVRGWTDKCEEIINDYDQKLNGYLTDYESLYQGYYGLLKFHSVFTKKK